MHTYIYICVYICTCIYIYVYVYIYIYPMGCKCQITYPRAGCSQHDLHHAIAVVIERRLGQRSGKHVGRTRLIGLTTFHLVKIREINC